MALKIHEQIKQLIEDKDHILITFRSDGQGDAIASATALLLYVKRMGKRADIVCDNFSLPKALSFLKGADQIKPSFSHLQKFIFTVDVSDAGLQELSYDVKDKKLRIYVTPKHGFFSHEHIKTGQTAFKYDLIITLDTPDLGALGELYTKNADLFYKTPTINIDHHPSNEQYGTVNFVDTPSTSTSEALYHLFTKIDQKHITEPIAHALLTGMISHTRSFKTAGIRPTTLETAAKLVSLGARRDEIVEHLFRTRSIGSLKLWGQALAHLTSSTNTPGLVWTTLTREDFTRNDAQMNDLQDIIDELINNSPEADIILLMHEDIEANNKNIHVTLYTQKHLDTVDLLKKYHPTGDQNRAHCTIKNTSLKQVERDIVSHIEKSLKQT